MAYLLHHCQLQLNNKKTGKKIFVAYYCKGLVVQIMASPKKATKPIGVTLAIIKISLFSIA